MRVKAFLVTMVTLVAVGGAIGASAVALQSEWSAEGEPFSELKLKEEKTTLSGVGAFTLSVPSKSLVIECAASEGSGTYMEGGTDKFKVSLSKCKVIKPTTCKVSESLAIEGKTESILAGGAFYDAVLPLSEGKGLITVTLSGGECTLPEKTEVIGSVAAQTSSEELVKRPMTFSEGISNTVNKALAESKEPELALTFSKSTAFFGGEFLTLLAGTNSGKAIHRDEFTRLCEGSLGPANNCVGKVVASGGAINMVKIGSMIFNYGTTTVTCTGAKIEGNTLSAGAAPLPADASVFAFSVCTNNGNGCPVVSVGTPYRMFFDTNGLAGSGVLRLRGTTLKITCNGTACEYKRTHMSFTVAAGNPAKLLGNPRSLVRIAGPEGVCGESVTWEGSGAAGEIEYEVLAPKPLYVTG